MAAVEAHQKRSIRYSDLEPELREFFRKLEVASGTFDKFIHSIEVRTAEREQAGETDQLIYYLLQSSQFTRLPRIEPALSAREFVLRLVPAERAQYLNDRPPYLPPAVKIPKSVVRRIDEFVKALERPTSDERLTYFKSFLQGRNNPSGSLPQLLAADYERSMKFLYQKEFLAKNVGASKKGSYLASLYQDRGHSTDTRIESSFAVWTALSVLKRLKPSLQLNRVLIVGPGLDLAPRTDLVDLVPPQSYQPFAVADALLSLDLSTADRFEIHSVDIDDKVVQFFRRFPKRDIRKLTILSSYPKIRRSKLSRDYQIYFRRLGEHIGAQVPVQGLPARQNVYMQKSILVRQDVADRITAEKLNIITERYDPSPQYDLIVVTNVFLYFNQTELRLALTNIRSMLRKDGYLVHNEFRPELESLTITLGLEPIQARTLRLSAGDDRPLLDGFVIHKKSF